MSIDDVLRPNPLKRILWGDKRSEFAEKSIVLPRILSLDDWPGPDELRNVLGDASLGLCGRLVTGRAGFGPRPSFLFA